MKRFSIFLILFCSSFLFGCALDEKSNLVDDAIESVEEPVVELQPIDTFSFKDFNTVACILAGEEVSYDNKFSNLMKSSYFEKHKQEISKIWDKYASTLESIEEWRKINIPDADTVFYPFAGPDFNYLASFFPNAKFSVLIGLEDCGSVPFANYDENKDYSKALDMITKTISTNVNYSFFRTNGMKDHFKTEIDGTLPIVMMYLIKHDYEILNINPVKIGVDGSFEYTDEENVFAHTLNKDFGKSYEIVYKDKKEGILRKVCYIQMNLADEMIDKESFTLMMDKYFNNCTSFLKAATYLLDLPYFSVIRNLILDKSDVVVTGPSGIQYRHLDDSWDITLYGNYIGPIQLFNNRAQPDLRKAYKEGEPRELDFKFDYDIVNSSLIVAKKKYID